MTLRFIIENSSPTEDATSIFFSDNLDRVVDNLAANAGSVPQSDICGPGSSLSGSGGNTSLNFSGGSLAAGRWGWGFLLWVSGVSA